MQKFVHQMYQKRQLLLLSSSRLHGYEYLQHAKPQLLELFKTNNVSTVLFVPYALKDWDKYTANVAAALQPWGYHVEGLHTKLNAIEAVQQAQAIFIGGGNTFVLLKTLYDLHLVDAIRKQVLQHGLPYIGSSAGTNVATRSIHTTNDMPMAYPPSYEALALIPFNINPHYLDTEGVRGEHKGETRDERLNEFLEYHNQPVLGLREGASLRVVGDQATLVGQRGAKLFQPDSPAVEYAPNSDLSFLLQVTKQISNF